MVVLYWSAIYLTFIWNILSTLRGHIVDWTSLGTEKVCKQCCAVVL